MDYKSHRQNCTPRMQNASSSGFNEQIYTQLEDADGDDTRMQNASSSGFNEQIHKHADGDDTQNASSSGFNEQIHKHADGDDAQQSDKMTIDPGELSSEEQTVDEPDETFKTKDDSDDSQPDDSDDSNQPEDEEDEQTDEKIWNAISHWCITNREDALDGFRYWFQFCRKLDHDPTIQKILEFVQVLRDENDSLTFKDALDLALMKRKYLVYETLKAFKTEGIWKTLLEEPDRGLDVFQWLKKYILVCKSMKRDPIFNSVMK